MQQSLARQKALNEAERRLGGTARYGVNKFSDLTPEEFQSRSLYTGCAVATFTDITGCILFFSFLFFSIVPSIFPFLLIEKRLSPRRQLRHNQQTPDIYSRKVERLKGTRFDWRDKGVIGSIRDQYRVIESLHLSLLFLVVVVVVVVVVVLF